VVLGNKNENISREKGKNAVVRRQPPSFENYGEPGNTRVRITPLIYKAFFWIPAFAGMTNCAGFVIGLGIMPMGEIPCHYK